MRGLSGVVSATVLAVMVVAAVAVVTAYTASMVAAVERAAAGALARLPPRMVLEPSDPDGCSDGSLDAVLRIAPLGAGAAYEVAVLDAATGAELASARLSGGAARLTLPCDRAVVILVRGPSVWLYRYELDPTKPCLQGYLVRGRDLLEARCGAQGGASCSWYLDPLLYRATGDPVGYRGYAAAWASEVVLAFAHYGPMYAEGARLRLCDTGVARAPIYILYAAPGELFRRVTGAEPPACLGVVDSMLYVPWLDAFIVSVYTNYYPLTLSARYYLVFANGTYIELPAETVRGRLGLPEYVVVNATVGGTRILVVDGLGGYLRAFVAGDALGINYTMRRLSPTTVVSRLVLWPTAGPLVAAANAAPLEPGWAYTASLYGVEALGGGSSGGAAAGRAVVMEFRNTAAAVPSLAAYTVDVVVYERCRG